MDEIQHRFNVEMAQIQIKMNLLALAKDMIKDNTVPQGTDIRELYLELREEVLNIPNPDNPKPPEE